MACEQPDEVHLEMWIAIGIMEKLDVLGQSIVNIGSFLLFFYSRYMFGDVHLGQSCRLKISSVDLLSLYL
ncbi:hypothetical protein BHE74_00015591 [Ensete ventricosum]|nr:hypothetical protein GW17_00008927 [Ensete ventricosum]RWW76329.1 hypothetical protein BHE74_00015591 [Ensete ventricosum]RZS03487.1 hypothetical protein BHM03_00033670 [Ensete ventricosum]